MEKNPYAFSINQNSKIMNEAYYVRASHDLVKKLNEIQTELTTQQHLMSFMSIEQLPKNLRLWEQITRSNDLLIGNVARYIRHLKEGVLPL
jgi:hypothetical protein